MDQNDGRTGDDDIPVVPEVGPPDDSGARRIRRDSPSGSLPPPVGERKIHAPTHYQSRVRASLGADDSALVERYVPIRIYLQDGHAAPVVERAVARLLTLMKVSIESSGEPEIGSWFRSILGKTQEPATRPELDQTFSLAARAVMLNSPDGNGGDIGISQAAAAAELIRALDREPSAAIQIGSMLIVKHKVPRGRTNLIARTLTKRQMLYLEDNPELLKDPSTILDAISALDRSDVAAAPPRIEVEGAARTISSSVDRDDVPLD